MPSIVLKDLAGDSITYDNVEQIVVKDTDGRYVYYTLGGGGGSCAVTLITITNYTDDHLQAIQSAITSPAQGDIAIIKAPIDGTSGTATKWERTAYIWDDFYNTWVAMDGNYSMDNVFLSRDLTATTKVGYIGQGDTITKGTSIKALLSQMFQQEKNPTIVAPYFTYAYNVSKTSQVSETDVEGAVVTPILTVTFHPGSYEFGPSPNGVTFTEGSIDGTARTIIHNAIAADFSEITLSTDTSTYSKGYGYTYSSGLVPVTNIGNPYPAGQIPGQSNTGTASRNLMSGQLSVTVPTISIVSTPIAAEQEVGTEALSTYTITINNPTGIYPYGYTVGQNIGATNIDLVVSNRSKTVDGMTSTFDDNTETGSWPAYYITDEQQTKYIQGLCNYSASNYTPVSQYGNAVPIKKISAGNAEANGALIIPAGVRHIFWGYTNTATITSDVVRSVVNHRKNGALNSEFLDEDTTKTAIIIAAPQGTRTLTSVVMPSSSYANVTGEFVKLTNPVMVHGANNATAIAYDVWVYNPATMGGTYSITMK